jgi:RpiB/LacA/LacB family sugar-phosphate isomerase
MRVAVACDHGGFPIKKSVIDAILQSGHDPLDLGTFSTESVDYPDYVEKLGESIIKGEAERGIMVCGSGVGACIAANKMKGIYAAICHDPYSAHQGVEHDAMNVLCLGGRIIGLELVKELVPVFLNARFVGGDPGEERHARRVKKTRKIEENH